MNQVISPFDNRQWKSIDGQRVDFEGRTFWPRARYLYWAYVEIMLGLANAGKEKKRSGMPSEVTPVEVGSTGEYRAHI